MKSDEIRDEVHEEPEDVSDRVGKEPITEEPEDSSDSEEETEEESSQEEETEEESEEESSQEEEIEETEGENEEVQSEYDSYTTIDYTSKLESIENSLKFNSLILIGVVFVLGLLMGLKRL